MIFLREHSILATTTACFLNKNERLMTKRPMFPMRRREDRRRFNNSKELGTTIRSITIHKVLLRTYSRLHIEMHVSVNTEIGCSVGYLGVIEHDDKCDLGRDNARRAVRLHRLPMNRRQEKLRGRCLCFFLDFGLRRRVFRIGLVIYSTRGGEAHRVVPLCEVDGIVSVQLERGIAR